MVQLNISIAYIGECGIFSNIMYNILEIVLTREPCVDKLCYNTFGHFGVGRIRPMKL